jgi:hypothetical protein
MQFVEMGIPRSQLYFEDFTFMRAP